MLTRLVHYQIPHWWTNYCAFTATEDINHKVKTKPFLRKTSSPLVAFSMMTYKPSKLGQTDLVFGLWSEFISRSVHAGLQVSTCSGYDLFYNGWHIQHRHTDLTGSMCIVHLMVRGRVELRSFYIPLRGNYFHWYWQLKTKKQDSTFTWNTEKLAPTRTNT